MVLHYFKEDRHRLDINMFCHSKLFSVPFVSSVLLSMEFSKVITGCWIYQGMICISSRLSKYALDKLQLFLV